MPLFIGVILLCLYTVLSCNNETDEQNAENAVPLLPSAFEGNSFKEISTKNAYSISAGARTLTIAVPTSEFTAYLLPSLHYFDPHTALHDVEVQLAHALYSSLFSLHPVTGAPLPHIVQSWTIQKEGDAHTYTFTIRDLQWSDGTPLSADHIRYSLLRYLSPVTRNPYATILALSVKNAVDFYSLPASSDNATIAEHAQQVAITAVDPHTLEITAPSGADLLSALAHPTAAILPVTGTGIQDNTVIFDVTSDDWNGLGAFTVLSSSAHSITLRARKNFWKRQWVRTIHYNSVENTEDALQRFASGDVDWVLLPYGTSVDKQAEPPILAENIRTIEYASEITMDVPMSSTLRTVSFPQEVVRALEAERKNVSSDMDVEALTIVATDITNSIDATYGALQRVLIEIMNNVTLHDIPTLAPHAPQRLFLPTMALFPAHTDNTIMSDLYMSSLLPTRSPLEQEDDTRTASTLDALFAPLRTETIRIAYSDSFLLKYAEQIAAVFRTYDVPTEIIALPLRTPATERYDIAIRNISLIIEHPIGILARYWWLSMDSEQVGEQDSEQNREQGLSSHNRLSAFIKGLEYKNARNYFNALVDIEQELLTTMRIIPLGYIAKQEIIDTTEYPWWTPLMSWHPWFP